MLCWLTYCVYWHNNTAVSRPYDPGWGLRKTVKAFLPALTNIKAHEVVSETVKNSAKSHPFATIFFCHVGSSETAHQIWSLWRQWNGLSWDHFNYVRSKRIVSKETKFGARFHLSQRGRKNGRKKGGSLQRVFNGLWDHLMGFYVCECRWESSSRRSRIEEVALTRLRIGHCHATHSHHFIRSEPPDAGVWSLQCSSDCQTCSISQRHMRTVESHQIALLPQRIAWRRVGGYCYSIHESTSLLLT